MKRKLYVFAFDCTLKIPMQIFNGNLYYYSDFHWFKRKIIMEVKLTVQRALCGKFYAKYNMPYTLFSAMTPKVRFNFYH